MTVIRLCYTYLMHLRSDTILASFVVGVFSSFLTAMSVILIRALASYSFPGSALLDLLMNIYLLFFFSAFVFFKGSTVAAWLLYRHDVAWGYTLPYRKVFPIFFLSLGMAAIVFFAVYYYITTDVPALAYLSK